MEEAAVYRVQNDLFPELLRPPLDAAIPKPSREEAWDELCHGLALALRDLDEDDWLILSLKDSNRFVQFMAQGAHGFRAETVSDYYLPEDEHLTDAQFRTLVHLGWRAPTGLPDEFGPATGGSPNYFIDLAPPISHEALALLAVATLIRVHGARHPGDLEYAAETNCGHSIRFPHLKVKRAR